MYRSFFSCILSLSVLFAEEALPTITYDIANFQKDPSAIVAGCVNVITGDFFDTQRDLFMVGGQPLTLERSYCSSDNTCGGLSYGWHFNHQGLVQYKIVKGPYGGQIKYGKNGKIKKNLIKNGLTNNSSGLLSGKTNLKNSALNFQDNHCFLRHPDSSLSVFDKICSKVYQLRCDSKANGMSLHYEYQNSLESVLVKNKEGMPQQKVTFSQQIDKKTKTPLFLDAYSNDKRCIRYHFQAFTYPNHTYARLELNRDDIHIKEPKDEPLPPKDPDEGPYRRYYLSAVERPNAPNETYVYYEKIPGELLERLKEKRLPDNRFLRIKYYPMGEVSSISGPIGTTLEAIPLYKFCYGIKSCSVEDALGHQIHYFWKADKRLKKVIKANLTDRLFWGKGADLGNLKSRVCSANGENLFCKYYCYDDKGNVTYEFLYGNLTGHNSAPIIIDKDGLPKETFCERVEKSYIYSQDGRNLLLVESEGNRSKRYIYYPESDQLALTFTMDGERIVLRNGYCYDDDCNIVVEIMDDGCSSDPNDLTGATFRKIKRIQRKKEIPFGVPEVVEEYSQNPATREEFLLRMQVNSYSIEGRLLQQDYYGSDRDYAYSLYWEYNSFGNVTKEVDALGHVIFRTYDNNGNLKSEQGPRSDLKKEFTYDYSNRLSRIEEIHTDKTLVWQYKYDLMGRKTSSVDCYGQETFYNYDEFDRVIETISPAVNGMHAIQRKVYDSLGNVRHAIDPLGNVTSTIYNLRGKPVNILYPDGTSEHFNYTLHGPLLSKVETNGCSLHYTYDYQDRIIETICLDPCGNLLWKTSAVYYALDLLSELGAQGNITEYSYDIHGRKIAMKCGDLLEEYEYDTLSRMIKQTTHYGSKDNEKIVKVFRYDNAGQILEEWTDAATCKQFCYDETGKQTRIITHNQQGINCQEIHYNSYGIPCEVIDELGNVTKTVHFFQRNANSQWVLCQTVIDPLGNQDIIIKDPLGRDSIHMRQNAMGDVLQKREIFYDLNGNQTKIVENDQVTHSWQFDNMNRVVCFIEAEDAPEQKTTRYHFNSIGQLQHLQKPSGVFIHYRYTLDGLLEEFLSSDGSIHYTYTYDNKRNLIEANDKLQQTSIKRSYDAYNQVVKEFIGNISLHYAYDSIGRVQKLTLPDQSSISYEYEGVLLKKITRFSSNNQKLYTHTYDRYDLSLNPMEQSLLGEAGKLILTFDKKNRPLSILSLCTSEVIHAYDAVGNLLKRTTKDSFGAQDAGYAYDNLYQLTEESGAARHSYQFDSYHNCVAKDGNKTAYNHLNQIVKQGFVYDSDGRLTATPTEKFTYDALDRLIAYDNGNVKASYTYDAFNRRLSKTIDDSTWQYFYADQNEIGCFSNDEMIECRILGLGHGAEIGAAVAIELCGIPYVPIHDSNGNVTTLLSQKGKVADTYRYTAFGEEVTIAKLKNPWRFSSKRFDAESGLTYFGQRYYSPFLSRWLTPDPLSYQAGPNLYAYVSCNPLTHIDLYGLIEQTTRELPSAKYVKEVLHNTWENICDGAARIRDTFSNATDRISASCRSVADSVRSISDSVRSTIRDFTNAIVGYNRFPSGKGSVEGVVDGHASVVVCAGQMNGRESCFRIAVEAAQKFGSISVEHVINETMGLFADIFTSAQMIYFKKIVEKVYYTRDLIKDGVIKGGEHGLILLLHSQGAVIGELALRMVDKVFHKSISVFTFGGAKMLAKGDLKECVNYVSVFDPVPLIADPLGFCKALISKNYTIEFLKPEIPFFDHAFSSGPYGKQMAQLGRDYKRGKL